MPLERGVQEQEVVLIVHTGAAVRGWCPDPEWRRGAKVRVDSLRAGDRFRSIDGEVFTYERVDGASSGVHHVSNASERTAFAGCAEVLRVTP